MQHTPETYIESLYEEDPVLQSVTDSIEQKGMRQISVPPGYGRLLTLLVKLSKANTILEIGALAGYSGICLARGLPETGRLYSLELQEDYASLAKQNLTAAGLAHKVEFRIGDAIHSLEQLKHEGKRFDLSFIDANKSAYPAYLEMLISLSNPGAMIVGDNTLSRGRVLDPEVKSSAVRGMREFNRMIAQDTRLESTILPAYDGLAIARVRE